MALQELSLNGREDLSIMPLNKEFEKLSENQKYKLNKDGTLTLKNKLLMREGEHNEVYYSWQELKTKYQTGEGAGLFYDHDDSVRNYAGLVNNLKANDITKEIRGDILITNKQSALDISLGAKWGVSPTIDAEKLLKNGKKYAADPNFLSYSLVLRPAVRETMLNSSNIDIKEEKKKLEGKEREMLELANANKIKDTKIQELEKEAEESKKKLEDSEKKLEDSDKKIADAEKKESDAEAEKLCALECSIGFTTEAEKNTRLEELKSLSVDVRANLKSTHERYAKVLKLGEEEDDDGEAAANDLKENFLVFRKKYMEANPKATDAEVKAAFAKISENGEEEENMSEDLNSTNPQKRMKAELSATSAKQNKINSGILSYMKEQEGK